MPDDVASVSRRVTLPRVAIVGQGLLARAISDAVASGSGPIRTYAGVDTDLDDVVRDLAGSPDPMLLITTSDGWDDGAYPRVQEFCVARRSSWLPVRVELGRVVIGPLFTAGATGCVRCVELRRSLADDTFASRLSVRESSPRLADQPSPWLTGLTASTVGALVADEVSSAQSLIGRTVRALLYVDLETLAVSTH